MCANRLAHVVRQKFTAHEKGVIVEVCWWDLNVFIASGENLYPKGLLHELQKIYDH